MLRVENILPPNDNRDILIWVPGIKSFIVRKSHIARTDAERFLEEMKDDIPFTSSEWAGDRLFSHWFPLSPPKDSGFECLKKGK